MPYNTRRKSLSLPSLGIHVPNSSRSSSHRSSPPHASPAGEQPPSKKVKRSHSSASNPSPAPATPSRHSSLRFHEESKVGRVADTPPPSPGGASAQTKVDTQGIDDIIVVGVIEQLEKTGNRPHLLKELAAVLANTIPIVESSANPAAIISSRLANYLKRPWTALSKCPLGKELIGTHPKRLYYFLTTCPRQAIPVDVLTGTVAARIISPSLSSAASEEEDLEARSRERMSPSPEIDLSLDDADPFSQQHPPAPSNNLAINRRAASPPLEKEEREFTLMASSLQEQRLKAQKEDAATAPDAIMEDVEEETEESAARKNSEAAATLFGQMDRFSAVQFAPSSPAMKMHLEIEVPPFSLKDVKMAEDFEWAWSEMKNPENVDLDELEDLFGGY